MASSLVQAGTELALKPVVISAPSLLTKAGLFIGKNITAFTSPSIKNGLAALAASPIAQGAAAAFQHASPVVVKALPIFTRYILPIAVPAVLTVGVTFATEAAVGYFQRTKAKKNAKKEAQLTENQIASFAANAKDQALQAGNNAVDKINLNNSVKANYQALHDQALITKTDVALAVAGAATLATISVVALGTAAPVAIGGAAFAVGAGVLIKLGVKRFNKWLYARDIQKLEQSTEKLIKDNGDKIVIRELIKDQDKQVEEMGKVLAEANTELRATKEELNKAENEKLELQKQIAELRGSGYQSQVSLERQVSNLTTSYQESVKEGEFEVEPSDTSDESGIIAGMGEALYNTFINYEEAGEDDVVII